MPPAGGECGNPCWHTLSAGGLSTLFRKHGTDGIYEGLLGGIAVLFVVSGKVIAVLGRRSVAYLDAEEFEGEAGESDEDQPCIAATERV